MIGDPIYPGDNNFDLDWESRVRGNMRGDAPVLDCPGLEQVHAKVAEVYQGPLGPDYVHEAATATENFGGANFGEYAGPIGPGELYGNGPTAGDYDGHFNFSNLVKLY